MAPRDALIADSISPSGRGLAFGLHRAAVTGTAKAMVADLFPVELRGTSYGSYHALLGVIDLPASLIAGVVWQGVDC
jgi:hypothetical protein